MQLDPETLAAEETYKLLVGIVVPRPIAWVTTLGPAGVVNLAPFSAFTFVSSRPPMVAISVGQRDGVYKDTARNILAGEEFVVHIADLALLDAVHRSAIEHPPEVSEVDELGLATEPSLKVKPPRIAAAPVGLECILTHCLEFGETRSRLLVGRIVLIHLRDDLLKNGKIETAALNPIARLGGPNYATLGEIITMAPIHPTAQS
jgi:flavin reductase (DIM6/NTAB) family NADH-FMN oxidoreductase RutF